MGGLGNAISREYAKAINYFEATLHLETRAWGKMEGWRLIATPAEDTMTPHKTIDSISRATVGSKLIFEFPMTDPDERPVSRRLEWGDIDRGRFTSSVDQSIQSIARAYENFYRRNSDSLNFPFFKEGRFTRVGIFSPSDSEDAARLLKAARVGPGVRLFDAGSGDGRVALVASALGAKAVGIEDDSTLNSLALKMKKDIGRSLLEAKSVRLIHGKIEKQDFSNADVVYYTFNEPRDTLPESGIPSPDSNLRRMERQLADQLKPGSVVILTFTDDSFNDPRFEKILPSIEPLSSEWLLRPQFYRKRNNVAPSGKTPSMFNPLRSLERGDIDPGRSAMDRMLKPDYSENRFRRFADDGTPNPHGGSTAVPSTWNFFGVWSMECLERNLVQSQTQLTEIIKTFSVGAFPWLLDRYPKRTADVLWHHFANPEHTENILRLLDRWKSYPHETLKEMKSIWRQTVLDPEDQYNWLFEIRDNILDGHVRSPDTFSVLELYALG